MIKFHIPEIIFDYISFVEAQSGLSFEVAAIVSPLEKAASIFFSIFLQKTIDSGEIAFTVIHFSKFQFYKASNQYNYEDHVKASN